MSTTRRTRRAVGWMAGAAGFTVAGYAAYAGMAWCRYGRAARPDRDEMDALLDQFMPEYEVSGTASASLRRQRRRSRPRQTLTSKRRALEANSTTDQDGVTSSTVSFRTVKRRDARYRQPSSS